MGKTPNEQSDQFSEQEAKQRFEAALKSALNTPHKPLKDKPKVKFKSVQIPGGPPGPKRGRPSKGESPLTNAEQMAKSRAELKSAGASSHNELVREAKLASTTMDVKKPRKAKKKPGK
jgi:hypothetical protein